VSQRQPHEQIRRAFSELTRPPRPQLSQRVRDTLWERPAPDGGGRPVPLAPLVAVVVVLALVAGAVFQGPALVGFGRGLATRVSRALVPPPAARRPAPRTTPTPPVAARPSATPSASASPAPTAAPTEAPAATQAPAPPPVAAAPPVTLPGFSCSAQSGGGGQATMTTARVGSQQGYNRFVVQFSGPVPAYEVALQASPSFAQSGGPVTLQGAMGISVVIHDASGAGAFTGPTDMRPGFSAIQEARLLSDAQGTVQWGIGISRPACFHAWALTGPSRLVVDIADP
jgi:hypothetical protein